MAHQARETVSLLKWETSTVILYDPNSADLTDQNLETVQQRVYQTKVNDVDKVTEAPSESCLRQTTCDKIDEWRKRHRACVCA